jgi:hypothetical protein
MQELQIERIRTDGGVQSRDKISEEYVAELAELIKAGKKLPPIVVYNDGIDMWAADGHHRILASVRCSKPLIRAEVHKGTKGDAIWASCSANQSHGLRRTNADKRHAVEMALKEKPNFSDDAIAQHVGVSRSMAFEQRKKCSQPVVKLQVERVGVDGITRKLPMPNGNIPPPQSPKTPANPTISPPIVKRTKPSGLQMDEVGNTIPEDIQPLFDRGHEVKALLQKITEIRTVLNRAKSDEDVLYGDCHFQQVEAALQTAYNDLKATIPYAVCPWCHGVMSDGCRGCGKRGVVGQFRWDTVVPRELKP